MPHSGENHNRRAALWEERQKPAPGLQGGSEGGVGEPSLGYLPKKPHQMIQAKTISQSELSASII